MKWTLFFLFSAVLLAQTESQVTLQQAYSSALSKNETIADQSEQVKQAKEHYKQAVSAVLPTVSGSASYLKQQDPGSTNGVYTTDQPIVKVGLSQPLFRGFREFAGLRQTDYLASASETGKSSAVKQLYMDVASAFYSVLATEQDIRNIQSELESYQKRIEDLQQRIRIGRSRVPEVLTVEASVSSLKAQLAQTQGALLAAREVFAFVTALPAQTGLQDAENNSLTLDPVEKYLASIDKRPEVKTAQLNLQASSEGVSIAKGAHLPSVDLNANYYFKRYGILDDIHWDAGVALTLPIFNGGLLSSKVEESSSIEMQAELALKRAKRNADQEIRSFYSAVVSDQDQVVALISARDLSERNFKEQTRDYRNGLVTNIDVLQALTSFEEAKRALDHTRYQTKLDYLKLQAASETYPSEVKEGK